MDTSLMEGDFSPVLLVERRGDVAILTLNRPDRRNALTPELHHALYTAVQAAAQDQSVGVVVLRGAGEAFCAGGDVARRSEDAPRQTLEDHADSLLSHGETARLLASMPKPTVALVNGAAAGAGLALALACDLRLGCERTVMTTAYAKIGLSGDLGISYFLTRLVGSSKAREFLLLSDKIEAGQALALGLVNRLVDSAILEQEGLALADRLAAGPRVAQRYIKANVALAETESLELVMRAEATHMARCARTQDVKEAAQAFRDKRPPLFKGV